MKSLYDLVHVPGIATDLNHIDTKARVTGYLAANDGLQKALADADIVVVTVGITRKQGMTRDDLFKINASIIHSIFITITTTCPTAISCVVTNPVNSTLPVAAETLRKAGAFDLARLFGVTSFVLLRLSRMLWMIMWTLGRLKYRLLADIVVLLSYRFIVKRSRRLGWMGRCWGVVIHRVQFGGDEIVKSKQGAGSATTCMAYAGFRFVKGLLAARNRESVTEEAYVYLPGIPGG